VVEVDVKWLEEISGHLARIADAHERAVAALERVAQCSETVAAERLYECFSESSRHDYGSALRAKLSERAHEVGQRKTSP
jgi:hypothetical protein